MNTETVARATFGLAQVLREALQNSREFPTPAVPYPEPAINPRGDACHASSLRQFARASNTPSDHHVLSALLSPRVVIGFDARHHSAEFARVTAEVIAGAGGKAELMPRACPTPLLAFYLRESGADAGVMITASHNPARDNGYKVYLGGVLSPDSAPEPNLLSLGMRASWPLLMPPRPPRSYPLLTRTL